MLSGINVWNYQPGIESEKVKESLNRDDASRVLEFLRYSFRGHQVREYYWEFVELAANFLGEAPSRLFFVLQGPSFMRGGWQKIFIAWKPFFFMVNLYYHHKRRTWLVFFCSVCISKHSFQYLLLSIVAYLSRCFTKTKEIFMAYQVIALTVFHPRLSCESKTEMVNAFNLRDRIFKGK